MYPSSSTRFCGLGGNYISIVDDPLAVFYNPAALSFNVNKELMWSPYMDGYLPNLRYIGNFVYTRPLDKWGVGIGMYSSHEDEGSFVVGIGRKFGVLGTGISMGKEGSHFFLNPTFLVKGVEFVQIPGKLNFGSGLFLRDMNVQVGVTYFIGKFTFSLGSEFAVQGRTFSPSPHLSMIFSTPFLWFRTMDLGMGWKSGFPGLLLAFDTGDVEFNISINVMYGDVIPSMSFIFRIGSREVVAEEIAKVEKEREERERTASNTYLTQGIVYYNDGKYEEAINAFDIALVWNPDNKEAENWKKKVEKEYREKKIDEFLAEAEDYLTKNDYAETMRLCEEVLEMDSTNARALSLYDEAERRFRNSILSKTSSSKHSDYIQSLFEKGMKNYARGNYIKARDSFEKVLKIEPKNKLAKEYISKANDKIADEIRKGLRKLKYYESKGRYLKAYYLASNLLKLAPDNKEIKSKVKKYRNKLQVLARTYTEKGISAYEAGNFILAQKYFKNLLSIEPNNKTATRYLELIKNKISKKDADKLYFLGIEAYTNNEYEKALYYWEQVSKIYPDYPNLKINIRRAREKLKNIRK